MKHLSVKWLENSHSTASSNDGKNNKQDHDVSNLQTYKGSDKEKDTPRNEWS